MPTQQIDPTDFNTYEEYLDAQITSQDLYFLQDRAVARQLVELGYRGSGDVMKRVDFEARKKEGKIDQAAQSILKKPFLQQQQQKQQNKDDQTKGRIEENVADIGLTPFQLALYERLVSIQEGKMVSILFLRTRKGGYEISGYIDLTTRLEKEESQLLSICNPSSQQQSKYKLYPKPGDLSYFNWDTNHCMSAESEFFQVLSESRKGLMFRHKRDRKKIIVDPQNDSERTVIESPEYEQIVFYDHLIKRKIN